MDSIVACLEPFTARATATKAKEVAFATVLSFMLRLVIYHLLTSFLFQLHFTVT